MSANSVLPIRHHQDVDLFKEAINFTAAQSGFAPTLIEKDYFCSVVLAYLSMASNDKIVLKGGTCFEKVNAGFYRLSEDLDFVISMAITSGRAERKRDIAPVKRILEHFFRDMLEFHEAEVLTGANNSRQYIGALAYDSLLQKRRETIKIEISLREPLLEPVRRHDAATLLINPLSQRPLVPPFPFMCITKREAFAEKFRAAMTRRDPAIRDYYDIDYAVRKLEINPHDASLVQMVGQKIQVPGNEPIDVSDGRLTALEDQLQSRLKPVLRPRDYSDFDIHRSFELVKAMATNLNRLR